MIELVIALFLGLSFAQNSNDTKVEVAGWEITNESELSVVVANGNTESQTTSLKHKNQVSKQKNIYRFKANYLRTKENDTETGKSWSIGLRYERELAKHFRAFVGVLSERDVYSGYARRISADLGAKYFFIKSDKQEVLTELNYRATDEESVSGETETQEYLRTYWEWTRKWTGDLKTGLWAEYLHNIDDDEAYFVNSEVSLSYVLSSIVSVKLAYEIKYQNKPLVANVDKLDELYTTSLVASF